MQRKKATEYIYYYNYVATSHSEAQRLNKMMKNAGQPTKMYSMSNIKQNNMKIRSTNLFNSLSKQQDPKPASFNCQKNKNVCIYNLLGVSQKFSQTVYEVRLFPNSATNLAISLRSCQSNLGLGNKVMNFRPNFIAVGK